MRECVNALREGRHECCNHHVYIVKKSSLTGRTVPSKSYISLLLPASTPFDTITFP